MSKISPSTCNSQSAKLRRQDSISGRVVAILVAEGVDADALYAVRKILEDGGAIIKIIAPDLADVRTTGNRLIKVDHGFSSLDKAFNPLTMAQFDALFIPHGRSAEVLQDNPQAMAFVIEAYQRSKVIATSGDGLHVVSAALKALAITLTPHDLGLRVIQYKESEGSLFFRRLLRSIAAQRVMESAYS